MSSTVMEANAMGGDGSSDNTDPLQYKILTLTFNQDCTYVYSIHLSFSDSIDLFSIF